MEKGFTIVELLIVIIILGVLVSLVVIGFNGVQQRAQNALRLSEAKEWAKIVNSYVTEFGTSGISPVLTNQYCLGTGFTDYNNDSVGDCWDANTNSVTTKSENASLNIEWLKVVGKLPNSTRSPISGNPQTTYLRLGPVVGYSGSGVYYVQYWLETTGACPYGTYVWNDTKTISCRISIPT